MSLFWRVFVINAVLLVGAATTLAVSPATVSSELLVHEVIVLGVGVALVLALNLLLLRRTLDPLRRLTRLMHRVDLLKPGERLRVAGGGPEVEALASAFNEMVDRLEGERLESGRRAIEAQEHERRRVALELHDEVGQLLTGVVLGLDGLGQMVPGDLSGRVETMQEAVRDGAERVREIARGLRPESLEEFGLRTALVGLLAGVADRSGLHVERRIAASLPICSPEVELVVYRVAQESLTNVVRHAHASRVEVALGPTDGALELRVVDDGCGIQSRELEPHRGLRGMQERAVYVGGRLIVCPVAPSGTEVRLQVPVREAAA